ncbi:alpha-D-ribose 1-methylphosphonate 5-triphosphate diphosphatase [Nesterenkonia ebinurensis]|uniref:alpha-D-ribose 1-methylphosphonate 5-triphosphate diphosphatase n=1 Tax=Nesterenkonia ebinurensis TaxID=2608252 RepID=UPI00123D333B|nr:alpha-D-ribose 1-methylphosphonate 5-triphosphate diphosphatase [Nesterenkonia ebinurensis]
MTAPATAPAGHSAAQTAGPWQLGLPPAHYAVRSVRAVLPGRIVHGATVVVREGRIAGILEGRADTVADLNGNNLLLAPGFIDVHSDALEGERMPRAHAEVPLEFALASYEGRIASAGTTTMFHGAAFQHQTARGLTRRAHLALEMCLAVDEHLSYRVDHRVLHRLDVLSEEGARTLKRRLDALPEGGPVQLVSHEDHTPGQGQYADPQVMFRSLVDGDGLNPAAAQEQVQRLIREREQNLHIREANLAWLCDEVSRGRVRLLGHDPDSAEEISALATRGGAVAEFPTTLAAAQAAREQGLSIVAGAPNILRGLSHSGNISARELVEVGLVDALASDYLPTGLLAAAALLAKRGVLTFPEAVGLITSGPARVAGLSDRGALKEGLRADFALVDDSTGEWPRAVATLRSA